MNRRTRSSEEARDAVADGWQRRQVCAGFVAVLAGAARPATANTAAASLSPRALDVIGRALAFMQPPPSGGAVAVVYAVGDDASLRDAEAIAHAIGDGLKVNGGPTLPPVVVAVPALAKGGFALAIAAAGASSPSLAAAVVAAHLLCVTADRAAVQAGSCSMAVNTEPRVDIVLNHALIAASDISFALAFRMTIREI
jgi:hypothetical protein